MKPCMRRRAIAGAALLSLLAACAPGGEDQDARNAPGPEPTITPEPGATGIAPNTPVRVETDSGTITDVSIEQVVPEEIASADTTGEDAESAPELEHTGTLNETGDRWTSDWNLRPGAAVTVIATASDEAGRETEVVSEFTTLPADGKERLEVASTFPADGQTVGVGMPVIVDFGRPVTNKTQVENSIQVVSEEATRGAWNWLTDETAVFRPEEYWEPHQKVTVDLRLAGVEAGDGVYGTTDRRLEFEVGRELIATMHVPDHELNVAVDGEKVRSIPVSNGAADRHFNTTTSGVHLTMEKYSSMVMDSASVGIPEGSPGHYRLDVDWAVRTSNSGEFTHSAPWNSGNLGSANTSNGCTNMAPNDARWFHDEVLMGDVLETTGTDRELEWDNGWGYYQRSWEEWLSHSETGEPHVTDGSATPGTVHGEDL
ncbi:Ig-like domain-containing protein [Nocardiopsis sp. LDBS1602]|nr:Ig-like domain-containing protein [Nocardiopsis sp. LDBS1602]MEC3895631.1 Ig-like domain-containing protein [Nocardiopsis sp. LDBS1602]